MFIETRMIGSRGNLAMHLAYVDTEVVGVKDRDAIGVRELRAERNRS